MDTVTYPQSTVSDYLGSHFTCLKINMFDRHPDFKAAIGATKVMWAPAMIFSDAKGRELRRYIGWLPEASFLAELRFVRATFEINRNQFDAARDLLAEVIDEFPDAEVTAEAMYWHGIARFLGGKRDMDALADSWNALLEKFPGSRFASHASVIEDVKK